MVLNSETLVELEQLYQLPIKAGITRLCDTGAWPRPRSARRLKMGYDFYYDDINELPEANTFIQRLADDSRIRNMYFHNPSEPELYRLYDYWIRLLLFILQDTDGDTPSSVVLGRWFKRFLKELYTDTAIWKSVDTVNGLRLNDVRMKLDNNTSLISIPGYQLERILGEDITYWQSDVYFRHEWFPSHNNKTTIITTTKVNKRDYAGFDRPHTRLTKDLGRALAIIQAIRLCKPGVPRLQYYAQFHISRFPLADAFSFAKRSDSLGIYEEETLLDKADYKEIRALWLELMKTGYSKPIGEYDRPTPLDVALGRFSKTYEMQNWLDCIVDLTIAMESLFGPRDQQELRHRISLRAAWLLGNENANEDSNWSNTNIYKRVRTMYDIRSARVHGRVLKKEDAKKWMSALSGIQYDESKHGGALYGGLIEKSIETIREIVRKAIRACDNLAKKDEPEPHWPLPDNFDEQLISANQRRIWQKAAGIRY